VSHFPGHRQIEDLRPARHFIYGQRDELSEPAQSLPDPRPADTATSGKGRRVAEAPAPLRGPRGAFRLVEL